MALPELIEIVPLSKPVRAEITVPGSKSITNRALILAALADGEVTLTGALWSEDTQIMVECLQKLGFEIRVENDTAEFCNRTITVKGLGGKTTGTVCGQCGDGGAVFVGVRLSGRWRLSFERRGADARTSAGGAVFGVARTRLSRRIGKWQ